MQPSINNQTKIPVENSPAFTGNKNQTLNPSQTFVNIILGVEEFICDATRELSQGNYQCMEPLKFQFTILEDDQKNEIPCIAEGEVIISGIVGKGHTMLPEGTAMVVSTYITNDDITYYGGDNFFKAVLQATAQHTPPIEFKDECLKLLGSEACDMPDQWLALKEQEAPETKTLPFKLEGLEPRKKNKDGYTWIAPDSEHYLEKVLKPLFYNDCNGVVLDTYFCELDHCQPSICIVAIAQESVDDVQVGDMIYLICELSPQEVEKHSPEFWRTIMAVVFSQHSDPLRAAAHFNFPLPHEL